MTATNSQRKTRARSAEKKAARRHEILDGAHAQLAHSGFDQFSMESLARETGLARASLSRYFGSREEVLLGLYQQLRELWKNALIKATRPGMSDRQFVEAYFRVSRKNPLRTELRSRLESTIKHNVSKTALAEEIEQSQNMLAELCPHLSHCTGLSVQQCHDLVISFGALMIGASQLDSTPSLERELLPANARRTGSALSSKRLFVSNGQRILDGLRREQNA